MSDDTAIPQTDDAGSPSRHRRRKVRWSELSPLQRGGLVTLAAAEVVLTGLAWYDLRRRPAVEVRGPKPAWFALTFVQPVGPLAYLALGRRKPPVTPGS